MVLVVGEYHGFVILVQADPHVFRVDGYVVGEEVDPWENTAKLPAQVVVVVLLIVEELAEADGHVGGVDGTGEAHAEGGVVGQGALPAGPLQAWAAGDPSRPWGPVRTILTGLSWLPWYTYRQADERSDSINTII